MQQGPDFGEEFAVVGRRTHDQRVVFENVADDIRNVGIRKVVNDDVFYTLYGQLPSDFLGHLGRIAIHRTIGDHHTRFAFVATQLIVDTYYAPDFLLPYGAVRRADRFDGKAAQFLEGFLYGGAVFAHDAGVVAAHLVPEMVQRKLAVQDTAVQGTERAERIRREEYLVFGAISDHHFGPVNHRRHIEREVFLAERNAFALFDFPGEGMDAVISVEHLKGFGIAHDLHLGVEQAQGFDRRGVVRLHVIDHQVIDRPVFQDRADIVDELFAERYFDRVDQSDFFVDDQV